MRLFDKLNSPVIVAVVLLLILVGNGLLLYRYNTSLAESSGSGSSPGLTQTEANRAALSTPFTEPTQLVGTEGTTKDATLTTAAEATTSSSVESPKVHSVTL